MTNTRSADDLIVREEAKKLGHPLPETSNDETKQPSSSELEQKPIESTASPETASEVSAQEEETEKKTDTQNTGQVKSETSDSSSETDEYGNELPKKKMYTEEEVNRMMRERFNRGKWAEQTPQQQQQVQDAAKNFQADPNSEENWEVQLEQFVEKTIQKVTTKAQEESWKRQQAQAQAEFEIKFNEGMTKYSDFTSVVQGKPITNAMMMAARSMNDPAAFIYAACKQHPKEMERIASIPDPYTQGVEIGRLEERMKKGRAVTSAPKPPTKVAPDASFEPPKRDIDSMIRSHAKTKVK